MIKVFLPEELEKIVKQEANAEHVSPGAYITMVLKEALADKEPDEDGKCETDESVADAVRGTLTVRLSGDDAQVLRTKAAESGLTPTAYLRRLVYTKEYVNIKVPMDDLEELLGQFGKLETAFVAAVGYLKRSEGLVYKQDIDLLNEYMEDIKQLLKQQVKISLGLRQKVEDKIMKEIRTEIKNVTHKNK